MTGREATSGVNPFQSPRPAVAPAKASLGEQPAGWGHFVWPGAGVAFLVQLVIGPMATNFLPYIENRFSAWSNAVGAATILFSLTCGGLYARHRWRAEQWQERELAARREEFLRSNDSS